jgi:hypothetical protein
MRAEKNRLSAAVFRESLDCVRGGDELKAVYGIVGLQDAEMNTKSQFDYSKDAISYLNAFVSDDSFETSSRLFDPLEISGERYLKTCLTYSSNVLE